MTMPHISIVSIILPTLLAAHGLSKKSLSPTGALTAFIVGFFMFSGSLKLWGVSLIGFYLLGSRATKYGKQKKAKLEAGYHDYGNRSGWQVLSNSFSAAVACAVWNVLFDARGVHAWGSLTAMKLPSNIARTYASDVWCPASTTIGEGWSRALLFAALGHFACCLGDTLASELGILSSSPPRLVTTGKLVPPGTNGGVSVGGTLASFAGGIVMGLIMSLCLITENSTCRTEWFALSRDLVFWGGLAGVGGSMLDSLLGATIQTTRYDDERKLVVDDHAKSGGKPQLKVISGWDVLTNNQVNVVSSVCCAVVVAMFA
ncbi:integral membrane family protein [Favolaschia claudopus]|uniref:Integral membrane family protein n=1 Tax=Favolaschia claudopus TaxID=2862362 RepID=A0AAW0EC10_9AGAR